MPDSKPRPIAFLVAIAALTLCSATMAQTTYRCTGTNGNIQWSDRPCESKFGMIGPIGDNSSRSHSSPNPYSTRSTYGSISEPPAYYNYLSGECRSLNDALRTASTRGSGPDTRHDLHKEWQRKCSEDAAEAMRAYSNAQREASENKRQARQQQEFAVDQARLGKEQCNEMLRILATKRKRGDLTDGERVDLKRFEDNYRNRCG